MHNIYPIKLETYEMSVGSDVRPRASWIYTWAFKGIANGFVIEEIYCQSKQMERRPNPSLPLDPPNIRVKSVDLEFPRQKTEKPVSRGNIHSGNISHIKILKPDQTGSSEPIRKNIRRKRHIEQLQSLFVAF